MLDKRYLDKLNALDVDGLDLPEDAEKEGEGIPGRLGPDKRKKNRGARGRKKKWDQSSKELFKVNGLESKIPHGTVTIKNAEGKIIAYIDPRTRKRTEVSDN